MSYCLNPDCARATSNPIGAKFCQSCGSKLLLQGRYRALQLIGQGGFGRTFLAVDEDQPAKPRCVIKQFFPQAQSLANRQKAAELFEQEAVRLEELGKHPQIPELIAHFEQDNRQYLVQEFIEGENLSQVLKAEGILSERQIRDLLHSLLPVVEFIHTHNVIHRDIKPENIIRRDDGQLLLVDFGAAKYTTKTALARTGTVIGSAGYAAPEQAGGKAVFSSDLYSLGVTCLHLLTQTEPFDLYSFSEATWMWRNYLSRPVSRRLGRILDKMVEMATSRRFQSAVEVLDALNSPVYPRTRTPRVIPAPSATAFPQTPTPRVTPASNSPLQNWRCVYTLQGHTQPVRSLAITPDGEILISGSDDNTIKLWQLATGEELGTLRGHSKTVSAIAMSADGEILASGSEDKTIKLWQLSTGMQIGTLTLGNWFSRDSGCVYAIAMSPQEEILASLDHSGAVKLWNLKTGQEIRRLKGDTSWINAIAISPTGKTLVAASGDSIKLWNLRTGGQFPILRGHNSWVRAVTFSPDGQTLASGSDDATIKLWNLKTGRELCTLRGHLGAIYSIAFSPIYEPFPSRLASDNRSQSTVEGMTFSASGNQASTAPFTQAFSKAQELGVGQILASSSDDRTIKLWDTSTGQELCTLTGHTRWVHRVVFSPSGQTLFSGGGDPMIYIWQCVSLNSRTSVQ
ncbi:serine/threonine protein kinase [Microcoleus sp. ZQ-A2]|nr:serine/threonine protein kinase [Microcoleus sp. FACHB-1]